MTAENPENGHGGDRDVTYSIDVELSEQQFREFVEFAQEEMLVKGSEDK